MDTLPNVESRSDPKPFEAVMKVLIEGMQEARGHKDFLIVIGRNGSTRASRRGGYLIRDHEVLQGVPVETALLERPREKYPEDEPDTIGAAMFGGGMFVHALAADPLAFTPEEPDFLVLEFVDLESDSTFFIIDDQRLDPFVPTALNSARSDAMVEAFQKMLGEASGDGFVSDEDFAGPEDGFDNDDLEKEYLALIWEEEVKLMAPVRFKISR